eukprot:1384118-Amorphochlora_amoeboformis.AAC.1
MTLSCWGCERIPGVIGRYSLESRDYKYRSNTDIHDECRFPLPYIHGSNDACLNTSKSVECYEPECIRITNMYSQILYLRNVQGTICPTPSELLVCPEGKWCDIYSTGTAKRCTYYVYTLLRLMADTRHDIRSNLLSPLNKNVTLSLKPCDLPVGSECGAAAICAEGSYIKVGKILSIVEKSETCLSFSRPDPFITS